MSANNKLTEPAALRKCENPHCLDGFVDQAGSNQEGTESWVDQVLCQICNPEETASASEPQKYVALTIFPDHGEVVLRPPADANPDQALDMLCRTETHDQAELIANALNDVERLRNAIITHRSQKADDRCIEDDDQLYAALGDGVKCDRRVGDKDAMLANCARFISQRCEGGGWPSYRELEEKNEKAKKAIVHVLRRIKREDKVRYHLGFATEAFDLLTEAAAALFNEPLERVVEQYMKADKANVS